jgi:protein-disulfide isomerase
VTRPTNPPAAPITRRSRRAQARLDAPPDRIRARRPTRRPAWQSPIALVSAAAVVVGAILVLVATRPSAGTAGQLRMPTTAYPASLTDGETVGSKSAPVVIELFADFQCPACKQFVTTELPLLMTDFVQPGVVRIEAIDIDIRGAGNPDESLELAAGAYCAAQQNRYWQFHDLVFWNQGRENQGDHNVAFIANVAAQAGVDVAAWTTCDQRTDIRKPIKDRTRTAFTQGINSTPTLRINGQALIGVPNYTQLSALITQLAANASGAPATSPIPTSSTAPSAAS